MEPLYKVGQSIKLKKWDNNSSSPDGHIVLIFRELEENIYYCSMYPGADSGYYWVDCVDLNSGLISNGGTLNTLQALNKYKESELLPFWEEHETELKDEFERKLRTNKIEKVTND